MTRLEDISLAALAGDALRTRSLTQDWLLENPRMELVRQPMTADPDVLAVAAGLIELFAQRAGQSPPPWTVNVPPASQPLFLLREAKVMKRLRALCEAESPLPLRRRRVYATPDYLTFA